MTTEKRKVKYLSALLLILIIIFILAIVYYFYRDSLFIAKPKLETLYVASNTNEITIYSQEYKESGKIIRGKEVKAYPEDINNDNKTYKKIIYDDKQYLITKNNLVPDRKKVVLEKTMYVLTNSTLYKDSNSLDIKGILRKGTALQIEDFNKIDDHGIVDMYKIKTPDTEGYIYSKYLVNSVEEANKVYDPDNTYKIHIARGAEAASLDFFPRIKPKFTNNVMPEEVRALYLNTIAIRSVDKYIELAKKSNINAFVVDIKEDQSSGYKSPVMEKFSPKSYQYANNSLENYQSYIKQLKDNGFYVIGRITTFKDAYYISDHPENAITSMSNGEPYKHNGSYWPSAYIRDVWEYNVKLAVEAVQTMGFNEIQFDYVRFPDGIASLQEKGIVNMKNNYNEYRSQAIQGFLMYATDAIHQVGAYVSADVFGESAHNYISSYGQYWDAISNVVDVISPMPYPDHFNAHQYDIEEVVWTVPYQLLLTWGRDYVQKKQAEIPTPAIVRSWIQAYDSVKSPKVTYDTNKIKEQIKALKDVGFTGGYMTWNASSSYTKYNSIAGAFGKE